MEISVLMAVIHCHWRLPRTPSVPIVRCLLLQTVLGCACRVAAQQKDYRILLLLQRCRLCISHAEVKLNTATIQNGERDGAELPGGEQEQRWRSGMRTVWCRERCTDLEPMKEMKTMRALLSR